MAGQLSARALVDGLVAELGGALDAVLGGVGAVASDASSAGEGWQIEVTASGDMAGTLRAWVDRAGGGLVAGRVLGLDTEADDGAVVDMLGEMWGQAAGALSLKPPFTGVSLSLAAARAAGAPSGGAGFELQAADGTVLAQVAVAADLAMAARPAGMPAGVAPAAPLVGVVPPERLDVVLDIDLPLVVRFARTVMTMKALAALGPGSIVDMDRSPDEPVQLLVGDRVIARGEVVVVGGNYGVRVTELASQGERARAMEAENLW